MPDTSPPDQQAIDEQAWSLVRQAPRGKVVTYGQIAQLARFGRMSQGRLDWASAQNSD